MKILKTTKLTDEQQKEITQLADKCREKFPLTLSFPIDEGNSFYLLYDPELISALALTFLEEAGWKAGECMAITHPDRHNTGCFHTLFETATEEIQDLDLFIPMDYSNIGAIKALEALGAELDSTEYRMALDLTGSFAGTNTKRLSLTASLNSQECCASCGGPSVNRGLAAGGCIYNLSFFLSPAQKKPVGKGCLQFFDKAACLYDFEIYLPLRGKGLGKEALLLLLTFAKSHGIDSLFLHVSGDNEAAVSLYKKTGFQISETLSYYFY